MSNKKILIIDDEPDMLSACEMILSTISNVDSVPISDPEKAVILIKEEEFDLIICDLLMPNYDGMKILEISKKYLPYTPFIIFTAYGTIERAVAAMKSGAFDFIKKPFEATILKMIVEKGLRQREFFKEKYNLLEQLEEKYSFENIVGKSEKMIEIFEMIDNISQSDANILITGENGTGKELIARSIHARSKRKAGPFVPVNCGAFPENLFEAELFGYEKGAFTGAFKRKIGLLEFADGGTFFLDEVCELPLSLQIKLLRTIQEQQLRRIGGNVLIKFDTRFISATNQNINNALECGQIREDFYYRINVINIHIPPLRERKEDIPLLIDFFLKKYSLKNKKNIDGVDEETLDILCNFNWPGNVRELQNIIERAVSLCNKNIITSNYLPDYILSKKSSVNTSSKITLYDLKQKAIEEVEKKYLIDSLKKFSGNISKVAEDCSLSRRHLYRLFNQYDIDPNKFKNHS
ncbi:sigma-54-dependent transcriptional regulator [Stygiobacter electus]|uniref:Sigma-54 dependent transcriptional regulator n=1 Tax=Stygiobacter electus TaxID=3032292 RepID=A0AAE3P368_9BACT|nr:sigma-54 dependent transcriptional regulator [Stygiobacter electus]MDF1612263.1 sigma-54 dependent transcriptional regulator [Stygiobacter electus]